MREGVSDRPVGPPLASHRPPAAFVYTHTHTIHTHTHPTHTGPLQPACTHTHTYTHTGTRSLHVHTHIHTYRNTQSLLLVTRTRGFRGSQGLATGPHFCEDTPLQPQEEPVFSRSEPLQVAPGSADPGLGTHLPQHGVLWS